MAKTPGQRDDYKVFVPMTTRWADNDRYGHINNVTYYAYFDSAANHYLIHEGGLDIHNGPIVGYVVNSACDYYSGLAYPDALEIGLRVDRLGRSSVQYGLAVFKEGDQVASAEGHFVHVFVDRDSQKSVAIPPSLRTALESIEV